MSSLYGINLVIQNIMDQHIDYETGEINEAGAEKLEKLGLAKEDMIDEMIKAHKNQQVMMDGIDAEMNRLKLRKEDCKKTQESIIKTIRPELEEGKKIETPEYVLKWTTSNKIGGMEELDPELEFNNPESDLQKFVTEKIPDPTYAFNLNEIKAELKKEKPLLPLGVYLNKTRNIKIN